MKAIGFKNFRNFEELPLLEFGKGVTFLVGQNNAGKSTLTKACRLMAENMPSCIKSEETATIDFGKICHSFKRAMRIGADNQKMEFSVQTGYFTITYTIDGMIEDRQNTRGNVSLIKVYDQIDDCTWIGDFEKKRATLEYNGRLLANIIRQNLDESDNRENLLDYTHLFIDKTDINIEEMLLKPIIREKWASKREEYQKWIDELSKDKKLRRIDLVDDYGCSTMSPFAHHTLDFIWIDEFGKEVHDLQCNNQYMCYLRQKLALHVNMNDEIKHDMLVLFDVQPLLSKIRRHYKIAISSEVDFLPTHETPQRSAFYIGDENLDYFETIVRDFYYGEALRERISWVSDRMKDLGIGTSIVLQHQLGEVVNISVKKEDGTELPLADLGRGSIQIIMLLLSVATKICSIYLNPNLHQVLCEKPMDYASLLPGQLDELSRQQALRYERTIIIEEPEQNLHPALQSKLADLFLCISKTFRCHVIVETHSEYMIRRTQAMIATGEISYDNNPFKVYYFPQGGLPYDMGYQESGMFENKFDEGFFDEAESMNYEVFQRSRQLKKQQL
ncbi:MAG: AAA family ATPase [Paludibacteraceae bacterium]|nr:AAA family ATPase [Paludibacteraceae bacterium]